MARRVDNYRRGNPSQQTAARLKMLLLSLDANFVVGLDKFHFDPFLLNGVQINERSLYKKDVRCFFENFLIVTTPEDVEILNKVTSTEQKQVKRAVTLLSHLKIEPQS